MPDRFRFKRIYNLPIRKKNAAGEEAGELVIKEPNALANCILGPRSPNAKKSTTEWEHEIKDLEGRRISFMFPIALPDSKTMYVKKQGLPPGETNGEIPWFSEISEEMIQGHDQSYGASGFGLAPLEVLRRVGGESLFFMQENPAEIQQRNAPSGVIVDEGLELSFSSPVCYTDIRNLETGFVFPCHGHIYPYYKLRKNKNGIYEYEIFNVEYCGDNEFILYTEYSLLHPNLLQKFVENASCISTDTLDRLRYVLKITEIVQTWCVSREQFEMRERQFPLIAETKPISPRNLEESLKRSHYNETYHPAENFGDPESYRKNFLIAKEYELCLETVFKLVNPLYALELSEQFKVSLIYFICQIQELNYQIRHYQPAKKNGIAPEESMAKKLKNTMDRVKNSQHQRRRKVMQKQIANFIDMTLAKVVSLSVIKEKKEASSLVVGPALLDYHPVLTVSMTASSEKVPQKSLYELLKMAEEIVGVQSIPELTAYLMTTQTRKMSSVVDLENLDTVAKQRFSQLRFMSLVTGRKVEENNLSCLDLSLGMTTQSSRRTPPPLTYAEVFGADPSSDSEETAAPTNSPERKNSDAEPQLPPKTRARSASL